MNFLEKTKKFEVLLSVCCVAIGIWLLIMQRQALDIICWILGAALIIYGVFVTIGYFTNNQNDKENLSSFDLAKGVVFSVMGVLVIVSAWIFSIITVVIGILLIINGIVSLQKALYIRRNLGNSYNGWKLTAINAIITTAFGVVLLFIPTDEIISIIIGIALIWYGVSSIVNYIAVVSKINKIVKQRQKNANGSSAEVIEIEDKTAQ